MTTTKKYRKVIVEGPDCSGKSTLVERLKNTLRWDSKYLRHADGNQFFRYLKEYSHQESIVFDRSHFSEAIYSQLWRGGSPFSKREKRILDYVCDMHGLVIFCIPSLEDMMSRYNSRSFEQQITLKELNISRELFLAEAKNAHIVYNSRDYDELEEIINKVKGMVQ